MPTIPRELPFGSLLAYSPKGASEVAKQSQRLCYELKRDGFTRSPGGDRDSPKSVMRWLAERIVERRGRLPFANYFSADVTLIPRPTHARQSADSLWVPMRICEELCRANLAGSTSACIVRTVPVQKASQSRPELRPTVEQHLSSISLDRTLEPLDDVLLVDDVVTRGATLMAAAIKILEVFPRARVRAFAVLRTFSDATAFRAIDDPCTGLIHLYESGKTHREP